MSRKSNLLKYQVITSGNAALSSITSSVTNIEFLDNIGYQINVASGTPTGVIKVQISIDYAQDINGNVTNAGNWVDLTPVSQTISAGSPSPIYFDMTQLSAPWIRLVYTRTSGSGTINAFITAKMI